MIIIKRLFFLLSFSFCLFMAQTHSIHASTTNNFQSNPSLIFTQEEQSFISTHPVIRVGNEMDWPPFDYNEYGIPKGYSIDYIKLIARKIGIKIDFIYNKTWAELLRLLKEKEIDILPVMYKNSERELFTLYSKPYYRGKLGVFSNEKNSQINSVSDLDAKRVGIEKSHGAIPIIKKQFPNISLIEIENNSTLVRNLATYKLDAIIGNPLVFSYYAKENQITNINHTDYVNLSKNEQNKTSFHIGVRKDWKILHQIIIKAMENITAEEVRAIETRWIDIPIQIRRGLIKLSEKERTYLENHRTIKVSNEMDFPPFDFSISSQPQGYSIDLINLLAERIGINIKFINGYTWTQLLDQFKNKQLDIIHTAAITPERQRYALYSTSYYNTHNHFITRKESIDIKNIQQLYGKTFAVGKGWAQEEYLSLQHPKINLLSINNLEEIINAVSTGQADAGLGSIGPVTYMLKTQNINNIKISTWFQEYDSKRENAYHIMTQKDAPELLSMFNKALATLTPGDIKKLENKWFGDNLKQEQYISLTQQEQNFLRQKKTITICIDPNWLPYERVNENGEHEGIGAEIIDLISKRINTPIKLIPTKDWGASINYIKQRKCDILSFAMQTPERNKSMNFTSPYITQPLVIVTRDEELFIDGINDIGKRKVAITKNYAFIEILKQQKPDLQIVEVDSIQDGLEKVQNGELFGYIGSMPTIAYIMQRHSFVDLKIAGKLDPEMILSIASRNDEPLLNSILEKALNSIDKNEKQTIFNRWYSIKFEQGMDYRLFWKIITVVSIIMLSILYWNRQLAKARSQTQLALDQLKVVKMELEYTAITDRLTGLYNRTKLDEVLSYEITRAERFKSPFALIILDIDYFKKVNDSFGHQVGDKVLVEIANLLKNNSREIDTVGRWGGEEFLIICPETDKEGATKLAEHLRNKISQHSFDIVGSKTASFGISIYKTNDTEQVVVAKADEALYRAKDNGRNRIEVG